MPANNLSDKKTKMNGKKKKNDSYVKKKIIFGLLFIEKNDNILCKIKILIGLFL